MQRDEIFQIFGHLSGIYLLMAKLIYGCGLRLKECISLRVKDIEFGRGSLLVVRSGKGDKDRVTVLPDGLQDELQIEKKPHKQLGNSHQALGQVPGHSFLNNTSKHNREQLWHVTHSQYLPPPDKA
jgi:integrase